MLYREYGTFSKELKFVQLVHSGCKVSSMNIILSLPKEKKSHSKRHPQRRDGMFLNFTY